MNVVSKVRNALRGIKQQWGSFDTKTRLWDSEYGSGRWDHCAESPKARVYGYIEKYARGGSILDLGCGLGNTANEIDASKYRQYLGVDISAVALKRSAARSQTNGRGNKNRFLLGDITSYIPADKHDVILFRESIYYVPSSRWKPMLDHYVRWLTEHGVLIVNVGPCSTRNARDILEFINRNYRVTEQYAPEDSNEFIAVFR